MLAGYGEIFVQGYFWHRPMPAAAASALLINRSEIVNSPPVATSGAVA
jgi:EAL domain-containing protein (putative c-di-GMP-specific phosphodiesterase class I)